MTPDVHQVIAGTRVWAMTCGDSVEVLHSYPDDTFHAAVMDPPSGIKMFGKLWDGNKGGRDKWIAWLAEIMREVWRTLRPGGHAVVWALPRTAHWTATAIEDAGFAIRERIHDFAAVDEGLESFLESLGLAQRELLVRLIESQASPVLHHLFGNGMLKGQNVATALDKAAGIKPIRVEPATLGVANNPDWNTLKHRHIMPPPTTPDAKRWAGWHSNIRPGAEHWILGRKPLGEKNLHGNVAKWGTGALNIGGVRDKRVPIHVVLRHALGCQVVGSREVRTGKAVRHRSGGRDYSGKAKKPQADLSYAGGDGREQVPVWECVPACAVKAVDEQSYAAGIHGAGSARKGGLGTKANASSFRGRGRPDPSNGTRYGDKGGASRFFPMLYIPKASAKEKNKGCEHLPSKDWRQGAKACTPRSGQLYEQIGRKGKDRPNHHPTVKALGLMRWLLRLVCVKGGLVLDPFAGSGSTGVAALQEGMRFVGVEKEAPYTEIALARLRCHTSPVATSNPRRRRGRPSMYKGFE